MSLPNTWTTTTKTTGCCADTNETDCLPDACGNDEREAALLARQQKRPTTSHDSRGGGRAFLVVLQRLVARDRNLLVACLVLVVLMNISTGKYLLYPFKIFSTWVHEMCHGVAAIMMGGRIAKLTIKSDGGGYANTAVSGGAWRRGFVASAGYPGTAVTGGLLLLYRRTTLGPTLGTIGLGVCLLLSVALYVRDAFGLWMLSGEGVFLLLAAWLLPAVWLDNLFNFLAVTIGLNALTTIQDLFAIYKYADDGEQISTDAQSVAEKWGFNYRFWAVLWLILSLAATAIGIVCARDARERHWSNHKAETTLATAAAAPSPVTAPFVAHTA
jgi:Peptidase M50B-like